MKCSQKKTSIINSSGGHPASSSKMLSRSARPLSSSVATAKSDAVGKENSTTTIIRTPTKSVGFNVNMGPATPVMGTPVVNLLARASPLSAERVRNTGDILGGIILMLSDGLSPHEQSLGIKALSLFAKESPNHPSWEMKFPVVLDCLLGKKCWEVIVSSAADYLF